MIQSPPSNSPPDRLCILMGLYNGAAHLQEQLDSFADQSFTQWDLIVSDDGSTDASAALVTDFAAKHAPAEHKMTLTQGPKQGFAANFLSLLATAPHDATWLAMSDQDDVWLSDHLARGVAALDALNTELPALYCSRTWVVTADLKDRRLSRNFRRAPSFANALVQNIASGNTTVLNRAAADLLAQAAARHKGPLPAHDWWVYQLITGAGGLVHFDTNPGLLYRQHAENVIGASGDWRARAVRFKMILAGQFRAWNDQNIAALTRVSDLLTPQHQADLDAFADLRRRPLGARLAALRRLGVYRQSRPAHFFMWFAAVIGKF
ncbi:MAG: glycosyltransferase [Paracoccaceae bacterium]|nr:glycosyltransferase [Paracoccaceae bacterium]